MEALTRRQFVGAGSLATAGALLAGCGSSGKPATTSSGKQTVQLTMWSHEGDVPAFLNRRAMELNKMPGAKFHYAPIKITVVPLTEIVAKFLAAVSAGQQLPDLLAVEINAFGKYMLNDVASHIFMDLTDRVASVRSQIYPFAWQRYMLNNRVYAIESDFPLVTWFYRPDLASKYGVNFPVKTWDDVVALGSSKLAPKGLNVGTVATGSGGIATPGISAQFIVGLIQRGGNVFGSDQKTVTFDSPAGIDAMTILANGLKDKAFGSVTALYGPPDIAAMKTGKEIAATGADWWRFNITRNLLPEQKGKWRIAAPPVFSGGGYPTSTWGGTGYTATAHTKYPDAAFELLQYGLLTLHGQQRKFTELGFNPTLRAAYSDPFFLNYADPVLGGQKKFKLYAKLAEHAPTQLPSPYWNQALTELDKATAAVLSGGKTPQSALTSAANALRHDIASAGS